jgi:hypothetical protein
LETARLDRHLQQAKRGDARKEQAIRNSGRNVLGKDVNAHIATATLISISKMER